MEKKYNYRIPKRKKIGGKMKTIQKIIIVIYGLLVAFVLIYVPWIVEFSGERIRFVSLGFSFIWQPPLYKPYTAPGPFVTVDIKRVILELIAITAVFATLFVLTLKPKKE